jgi:hypothetical protein
MNLVDCRVEIARIFMIEFSLFTAIGNDHCYPAKSDQCYGNVDIVDKETCLPSALKSPVHLVGGKELSMLLV